MAAIIAGVITAAAAAGSSVYATKAAQKAGKKSSKGTNMPVATPQGQAAQDQVLRLLFERMGQKPQSMQDYMQNGPQAAMNLQDIPFHQRELLGLGSGLPAVYPSSIPPNLIQALQGLGITPPSPPGSIFQGQLPPGVTGPPSPNPMTGPRR